jgi:hypothetical protein
MLRKLLALSLLLTLPSCSAPAVSNATCPSLPIYSPELQTQAADELDTLPQTGVIVTVFMPDYGSMRAAVRACLSAKTGK